MKNDNYKTRESNTGYYRCVGLDRYVSDIVVWYKQNRRIEKMEQTSIEIIGRQNGEIRELKALVERKDQYIYWLMKEKK